MYYNFKIYPWVLKVKYQHLFHNFKTYYSTLENIKVSDKKNTKNSANKLLIGQH